MENITVFKNITSEIISDPLGTLTILTTPYGLSHKKNIECEGNSLLTNYIYDQEGSYKLVYTIIDKRGKVLGHYAENDGILPILFQSPTGEAYVSVVPYHPDKELEISIPVFNREQTQLPKGNRPFTGDFIDVVNESSLFYNVDWWNDKRPDKMLRIEFKNGQIKKKHTIKIELPRDNNISIHHNEIHIVGKEKDYHLHRQLDEKGNEIRRRILKLGEIYVREIIHLSFDDTSYTLVEDKGLTLLMIDQNGIISKKYLIDIKDELYNTWKPERISENTYVVRFNTEFGNGWFTLCNDNLLEFFYGKEGKGYKNLLTDEIIEMPMENLALSSLNKTTDNSYAVTFHPSVERGDSNTKLIILNRSLA